MRPYRQRGREQAHTDDWLMTYADTITLLLCLFAVFLSFSFAKNETPQKAVETPPPAEQPVTTKPIDILEGHLPFHGVTEADQPTDDDTETPATAAVEAPPTPAPEKPQPAAAVEASVTVPVTVIPPAPDSATADQTAVQSTMDADAPSTSLLEIVNRLKSQGTANIEQKGDRITTLEMNSAAFFGSGSATLSDSGKSILQNVTANLKSDTYKDYQITVEGHTDDSPISTPQFPSNWELSTARASAVVHFFLEQGLSAKKLRAAGYADTFPIAPNRDASGNVIPENQARNRRVVILLEKIDKTE